MTENLQRSVSENFASELRSFFALCHLNLVFGSLAMVAMGTFEWFLVFRVLLVGRRDGRAEDVRS